MRTTASLDKINYSFWGWLGQSRVYRTRMWNQNQAFATYPSTTLGRTSKKLLSSGSCLRHLKMLSSFLSSAKLFSDLSNLTSSWRFVLKWNISIISSWDGSLLWSQGNKVTSTGHSPLFSLEPAVETKPWQVRREGRHRSPMVRNQGYKTGSSSSSPACCNHQLDVLMRFNSSTAPVTSLHNFLWGHNSLSLPREFIDSSGSSAQSQSS